MIRSIAVRSALLRDGLSGPVEVRVDDEAGTIRSVSPTDRRVTDRVLAPGFVDLQVNGIDDVDVAHADGTDWERLDELVLAQGTTSWCPTIVSAPLDSYGPVLDRIGRATRRRPAPRPAILGVHLEGPFLGAAPGAHRSNDIVPIDLDWIDRLPEHVVLVTLAAEQLQAAEAVRRLRRMGIVASIGHSRPTEHQFGAAVAAGASMVTHLFNGMSGLHHREPGLAAFALTEPGVALGLIADGVHVHRRMLRLAFSARPDDVVLVTDATAWRAGTAGTVRLALVDGAPRLPDGTLAGSCVTMDAAVRLVVGAGVPLVQALRAASTTPARVIGAPSIGRIEPGARADLVELDDRLDVAAVHLGGLRVR